MAGTDRKGRGAVPAERQEAERIKLEEETAEEQTPATLEENREQTRQALKDNLYRANPQLKNLSEEELTEALSKRKNQFLDNMDPSARQSFLEMVDGTKKEIDKLSKLSPKQLRDRVSAAEANEFRFILIKGLVLFGIVYLFCAVNYETASLFTIYDRIVGEWSGLMKSVHGIPPADLEEGVDL